MFGRKKINTGLPPTAAGVQSTPPGPDLEYLPPEDVMLDEADVSPSAPSPHGVVHVSGRARAARAVSETRESFAQSGREYDSEAVATMQERQVLPVVEEKLQVARRAFETGRVRLHKQVHSTVRTVSEPVYRDRVDVRRVPVNRVLNAPVGPRYEGNALVLPVMEEVLVVQKQLVLKEEIYVTRVGVTEASPPQQVALRSEEVHVERTGPGAARDVTTRTVDDEEPLGTRRSR